MPRPRLPRKTNKDRRNAYEGMAELLSEVPAMTNQQIADRITKCSALACDPNKPRERLIVLYALALAKRII